MELDLRDGDETQRAHYTARRKEVWEALHPEPSVDYGREEEREDDSVGGASCATNDDMRSDGRKKGPQHYQSFAAETAAITGQSKRDINRNVARAEAIGPDILKLSGTSLDKGVELDALAKLPGQYRDGDEKVLPCVTGQGCNAGASFGSFLGCPG